MRILNKKYYIVLFIFTCFFALISCDSNRVYDDYVKIDKYIWSTSEIAQFDVEIQDTTKLNNLFINIRHAQQYQYKNLWLFVKTTAPNGSFQMDTVNCVLANDQGRWMGSGLGDIWDQKILWKTKIKFPMAGKYKVEYQQGMRMDDLVGIMSVGLRVEKIDVKL